MVFTQLIADTFNDDTLADIKAALPFQFFYKEDIQEPSFYDPNAECVASGTISEVKNSQYGNWLKEYLDNLKVTNFKFSPGILLEGVGQIIKLPTAYVKIPKKSNLKRETGKKYYHTYFTKYVNVIASTELAAELLVPTLTTGKDGKGLNLIDSGTGEIKTDLVNKLFSSVRELYINRDRVQQQERVQGAIAAIASMSSDPEDQLRVMIQAARESGNTALADMLEGKLSQPTATIATVSSKKAA